MKDQVVVISGGVGGAKLALGLYRVLAPNQLTVAVNTGDDFIHLGLKICPDIDTTLYTLAGVANTELGWGRDAESWQCLQTLAELGGEDWFRLGDKDIALHLLRTQLLTQGRSLSEVIEQLAQAFDIKASVVPMSDETVATELETDEGRLPFQHYFVGRQCQPRVSKIDFVGADNAFVQSTLLELLQSDRLRAVIIAPSNPYLSIAPILAIPGMRQAIKDCAAPVVAVSPVIAGAAVKGPTAKIMQELGVEVSAASVAEFYGDLLDGFVLDSCDQQLQSTLTVPTHCTNTLMKTLADRERLATDVLCFADQLCADQLSAQPIAAADQTINGVNV